MSRKVGDWVWVMLNAGFLGPSHLYRAEIMPAEDDDLEPCPLCDDPKCVVWPTLYTEENQNHDRYALYHVSECQMLDKPYQEKLDGIQPIFQ